MHSVLIRPRTQYAHLKICRARARKNALKLCWVGAFLLGTLATGGYATAQVGADRIPPRNADWADWSGYWKLSYKKELAATVFPWDFNRTYDEFEGSFDFTVSEDGTVKGLARATRVSFRMETDGCASSYQQTCSLRCKGAGQVGEVSETSVDLIVSGQLKRQSAKDQIVHLKLTPTEARLINIENTCVGERGTTKSNVGFDWFCSDVGKPCSPSGHFLEIDLPLHNLAQKDIHTSEIGGGEEGLVRLFVDRDNKAFREYHKAGDSFLGMVGYVVFDIIGGFFIWLAYIVTPGK